VVRELDAGDFDAALTAPPPLATAVEQAALGASARRGAQQAARDVDEATGADAYRRQPI
jgi:hypothetical protein